MVNGIKLKDSIVQGFGDWDQNENVNWEYNKRRCMQEILPKIFLGPYSAAVKSELNTLKSKGITHIICVRSLQEAPFIKPNFRDNFRYLVLDIVDSKNENILRHFTPVYNFIEEALANDGKILVHGNTGVSRSAALVIAYVMQKYKLKWKVAYEFVLTKRLCISPNEGFLSQLNDFEAIDEAKHSQEFNTSLGRGIKRCFEEI